MARLLHRLARPRDREQRDGSRCLSPTALTRRSLGAAVLGLASAPRPVLAALAPPAPVIVASDEDVTTLDPHLIRNNHPIGSIVWSVFDSLVRRRPDGQHESRLAIRWDNPRPTVWRFQLRQGVVFHNGETLDAPGVVENIQRMRRSPFDGESQLWQQTGLIAVAAPDTTSLVLTTAAPSVDMLYWLEEAFIGAPRYFRETPPEHVAGAPVGSGPYRFVEWQRGDHVTLAAYDRYWGGAPPIRSVVFRTVPEASSRVEELKAGSVDLVPGLDPDSAEAARSPVSRATLVPGLRKMHVGIAQRGIAPLRDRRVRQALNHAVDVQTMIDTLQRGMTRRLASVINPPNNDPTLPPFAYDPARATALLHEAGQEGFAVEVAFDGKYPDAQESCEAVAAYLSAVGLQAATKAYETGHFAETLRARAFPGLYFYGFGALINPLVELTIFTGDAVDNASGYDNPAFDALVRRAAVTTDEAARRTVLAQAERLVWEDAPWIYLWAMPAIYGISRRLQYEPRPDDYVELYKARLQA